MARRTALRDTRSALSGVVADAAVQPGIVKVLRMWIVETLSIVLVMTCPAFDLEIGEVGLVRKLDLP
jgi:hypothetical protein